MYNQPYNFNPYMQQNYNRIPQPIQSTINDSVQMQPVNNTYKLNGKIVDSIETVKGIDIPLDGSTSYFPLASGEGIVTKQLQIDGTSKIVVYKPINEDIKEKPKYITMEDLNKELNKFDRSDLEDIRDEIKDIRQELKDLKKKKKGDD